MKETSGLFNDATSTITLMDMLYEHGMHERTIEIYTVARDRRPERDFINVNTVTLYAAACAKLVCTDEITETYIFKSHIKVFTFNIAWTSNLVQKSVIFTLISLVYLVIV